MSSRRDIKGMADRLISTLSSSMSGEKADAIVRDVAEELYRDVLGIDGRIVTDGTVARACGSFGTTVIASYKFEPKKGNHENSN